MSPVAVAADAGASGVAGALRLAAELAQHPFEIGLDEAPGAHVPGLLLAPDDLGLLEARELLHQRLDRERIELLNSQQVDVVDPALLALIVEVVVDFARADDNAADLIVLGELGLFAFVRLRMIPQQPMEARAGPESRRGSETARLLRSIDFGVIAISGLRNSRLSWRRSAWKKFAGVVQTTTCMLSSAQSCR